MNSAGNSVDIMMSSMILLSTNPLILLRSVSVGTTVCTHKDHAPEIVITKFRMTQNTHSAENGLLTTLLSHLWNRYNFTNNLEIRSYNWITESGKIKSNYLTRQSLPTTTKQKQETTWPSAHCDQKQCDAFTKIYRDHISYIHRKLSNLLKLNMSLFCSLLSNLNDAFCCLQFLFTFV